MTDKMRYVSSVGILFEYEMKYNTALFFNVSIFSKLRSQKRYDFLKIIMQAKSCKSTLKIWKLFLDLIIKQIFSFLIDSIYFKIVLKIQTENLEIIRIINSNKKLITILQICHQINNLVIQ